MRFANTSILLVEDDPSQQRVVGRFIEEAGYKLHIASNADEGLSSLQRYRPNLVITDIRLGDTSGITLLQEIRTARSDTPTLVMTAYGSLQQAIEVIRLGAFDYLYKPFAREQLLLAVYKALAYDDLQRENRRLKNHLKSQDARRLLGNAPSMQIIHELIRRMADSSAPVLILGESGTGKELAARLLHVQSKRSAAPFVAVNCAAIPATMLESELFGHIMGAFTGAVRDHCGKFEQADGGTLFLDEIGELPVELQSKLLRALQEQEITPVGGQSKYVNVRVITATNCDLEKAVHAGNFRNDLFYRLAVLPLSMPPLRERSEDIPLLAQHFIDKHSVGKKLSLSSEAIRTLQNYQWPGNVRELENLMARLTILASRDSIGVDDLPVRIQSCSKRREPIVVHLPREGFPLKSVERQAIMQALVACRGNQTKAAEFLDIPRHVLAYRLEKYGICLGVT